MKRTKFPYTAKSKAKVIRHAVSIDERRAKFRSDLISGAKMSQPSHKYRLHHRRGRGTEETNRIDSLKPEGEDRFRRKSRVRAPRTEDRIAYVHGDQLDPRRGTQARLRSTSPAADSGKDLEASSIASGISTISFQPGDYPRDDEEADELEAQDIEELWFPGCHADLGGGWPVADGEAPLSHAPLVWMVREAQRAGLEFDAEKMLKFNCCDEDFNIPSQGLTEDTPPPPDIRIEIASPPEERPDLFRNPKSEKEQPGWAAGLEPGTRGQSNFHKQLLASSTKGVLHDCLEFNNGLGVGSVLSWKLMEYMPFRRMDLRPDGSWKAITFPLPMGEVRDIPETAWIHHSAIRRMEANEDYRPGNLIIGGGGRGVRKAPKDRGIGEWEVLKGEGDAVGMTYVRKGARLGRKIDGEKNGDLGEDEPPKTTTNGK